MAYLTYSSQKALSTPPNAEDESIPWGFGFEFEACLERKLQDDLERQKARLERYGRFGMQADDARRPTPEDMRVAYQEFIASELEDVHTPSPPSSPESMPRLPSQSIQGNRSFRKSRGHNKSYRAQAPGKQIDEHVGKRQKTHKKAAPAGIKKRQKWDSSRTIQKQPSTHPMLTRSRKRAMVHT
jgi:hypothetical protein